MPTDISAFCLSNVTAYSLIKSFESIAIIAVKG